jgi:mono/diheme cytochrome c family protein
VTSRFRFVLLAGTLALAGCDDAQWTGPILYRDHERFAKDLAAKPNSQEVIRDALKKNFGDDLKHIRVPEGSGLRDDGLYLANFIRVGGERKPVLEKDPRTGKSVQVEGGYALYRKNCLHCHGVFGAGDGPTSAFLYPRPRDYRLGIYKFTSTNPVNAKPTRADLRKTILYGLHGTSMPGFEALMSASEIEQVIDYMTFLSIRGETERYLVDEAMNNDDKDARDALGDDTVKELITKVTSSWKEAETQVVNPSVRRVIASPESIKRGRDLYLSLGPG